jgi:uncharacterized Zn-binding protein involved in type VI secretion
MPTVKVNGTENSLVHKGSGAYSKATIPDVCKTPTPGGPVPMPYQNIAQATTLSGGSTTVKADGMMAAIKGSKFALIKSSTFIKEATWILYSFDVKIDGANACRLSDKMFHNSENTVNAAGAQVTPKKVKDPLDCGQADTYRELKKQSGKNQYDRDHVPSKSALKARARKLAADAGDTLTKAMEKTIDALGETIAIPKALHKDFSETYGGRSDPEGDANKLGLNNAAKRDLKAIQDNFGDDDPECKEAYAAFADEIRDRIEDDPDYYDNWLKKIINGELT